ncbi:LTA synthase family protein [Bdellovibrio svalbardensis]|uniref:Sulfatase-like hydrolase/transferase n=1 Tax=Bdellovibrio svalbardensis TaxID=2972972 RepID=A0ABT6DQB4_9BACT|nr:sulfatase-like hydrolase/transferase [Bdellovibrio svalbardensis]MDG0817338.1 sulfatase-like hydrolase/transferase [Bdellovibrio svalbardensis]
MKCKWTTAWFGFIFMYFFFEVLSKDNSNPFYVTTESIAIVFASLLLMVAIAEGGFFIFRNRTSLQVALSLFIFIYSALGFYHFRTDSVFDFSIIADHWKFLLHPGTFSQSASVINNTFKGPQIFWTCVFVIATWFIVGYDKDKARQGAKWSIPVFIGTLVILLFVVPFPQDEVTSFAKTAVFRIFPFKTAFQAKYKPKDTREYPLVREFTATHGAKERPHVFIVFVESFNANFVESKSPNGKEFTPFYNSLIPQGLYFENFYGQSIQTGRAHFAALCGLTSSVFGKEFSEFVGNRFHCLPQILKENGYDTVFSKANEDVHFDNTFNFTTSHGYRVMNSMGKGCEKEKSGACWGWGIHDDIFYKRFFEYLEANHKKGPVFGTLATISSHMPFNEVPAAERYIYPEPKKRLEKYSNAIRVSDEYLKTFFSELKKSPYYKNSIVIVTGDHSFPMGEHKNFASESFAYEENFKTPLLILDFRDERKIQPGRVKEAYSQLNLAPAVLDMVGISTQVHFIGDSLLAPPPKYIPLLQPYGGVYFAIVKYPMKYVLYDRTGDEYLYDLSKDPHEENNLIDDWDDEASLEGFRKEVGKVWFNYDLMVQDRIWPKSRAVADGVKEL